jgi:hypothetical protein
MENPMLDEIKMLTMMRDSVINRYAGDLRKWDNFREGGCLYTPLDTDNIRDLLVTSWGKLVHPQMIEQAFRTLIKDGTEHWPKASCQEDLDEEARRELDSLGHEIEQTEQYLRNLKRRARRLAKRVCYPALD